MTGSDTDWSLRKAAPRFGVTEINVPSMYNRGTDGRVPWFGLKLFPILPRTDSSPRKLSSCSGSEFPQVYESALYTGHESNEV
jgi:hypothetical protein